jgi:hypothetical protein
LVNTVPAASSTARLTKFSDAISSRPEFWRATSRWMVAKISGSVSARVREKAARAAVDVVDMLGG